MQDRLDARNRTGRYGGDDGVPECEHGRGSGPATRRARPWRRTWRRRGTCAITPGSAMIWRRRAEARLAETDQALRPHEPAPEDSNWHGGAPGWDSWCPARAGRPPGPPDANALSEHASALPALDDLVYPVYSFATVAPLLSAGEPDGGR
jgi:hypothetical protein